MLSTAVCLLSSCQNYLDLKPKNQTVVGTLEDDKIEDVVLSVFIDVFRWLSYLFQWGRHAFSL